MTGPNRKSRDAEQTHTTRESEAREQVWEEPALLDAPPPRPGMVQRWVRTSILGTETPQHVMRRNREGWQPRPLDTIPKDFAMPTIDHGRWDGCVGVEGSILCEMSEERVALRTRHFQNKTDGLKSFIDNNLNKVEKAGGQRIERDIQTSHSFGQRRGVADD